MKQIGKHLGPVSEKDRAIGERIQDAIAPMSVSDQLSKLATRFGTERVLPAVKAWVEFIESVSSAAASTEASSQPPCLPERHAIGGATAAPSTKATAPPRTSADGAV